MTWMTCCCCCSSKTITVRSFAFRHALPQLSKGLGAENLRRPAGGPALERVSPLVRVCPAGVWLQPEGRPPARAGEKWGGGGREGTQLLLAFQSFDHID